MFSSTICWTYDKNQKYLFNFKILGNWDIHKLTEGVYCVRANGVSLLMCSHDT